MIEDITLIIVFLFFSALFSASETALLSLDSIKLKRLQKSKNVNHLVRLLSDPSRFLTTILIGNMIVNIMLSTFVTSLLIHMFGDRGLALAIGVVTFLLLIFGEVIPKTFATKKPEDLSYGVARAINMFAVILFPLRVFFNGVARMLMRVAQIRLGEKPSLTHDELKSLIEVSHREGFMKENEKEMIRSVLELTKTTAGEIMTPRPDISAFSFDSSQQEAVACLQSTKHSKLPVYQGTIDNIKGVLYAKDVFFSPERDFKTLLRPSVFVPESMKIDDLLKDFQTQNSKIAIVVDEYGNTYGLVTFEDILEEIVGEIYDEYETVELPIVKIDARTFRISGKAPIDAINEELGLGIPAGDYETIAGYMLFLFERIPRAGDQLTKKKLSFTIHEMVGRRIKSIMIKKL